jgi:hypothetical protein
MAEHQQNPPKFNVLRATFGHPLWIWSWSIPGHGAAAAAFFRLQYVPSASALARSQPGACLTIRE